MQVWMRQAGEDRWEPLPLPTTAEKVQRDYPFASVVTLPVGEHPSTAVRRWHGTTSAERWDD